MSRLHAIGSRLNRLRDECASAEQIAALQELYDEEARVVGRATRVPPRSWYASDEAAHAAREALELHMRACGEIYTELRREGKDPKRITAARHRHGEAVEAVMEFLGLDPDAPLHG